MKPQHRLQQMIDAEKAVSMTFEHSARVWERLAHAVASDAPAMAVPLAIGPTTTVMVLEGSVIAVVVGTIGTAAIVATGPKPIATPSATVAAQAERASLGRAANVQQEPSSPNAASAIGVVEASSRAQKRVAPNQNVATPTPTERTPSALEGELPTERTPSTLDDELQLIKRAKYDLDRGQPHLARVWLDEHRSRFPGGTLAAERDGLEILMDCARGPNAAVIQRIEAYASTYPAASLVDRIRRACHLDGSEETPK